MIPTAYLVNIDRKIRIRKTKKERKRKKEKKETVTKGATTQLHGGMKAVC